MISVKIGDGAEFGVSEQMADALITLLMGLGEKPDNICFGCGRKIGEDENVYVISGRVYCWTCHENSCEVTKYD